MVSVRPNPDAAGRYSISETCAMLGLHRNTLRRYTEAGAIKPKYDKDNGRKTYSGLEIIKFWNTKVY